MAADGSGAAPDRQPIDRHLTQLRAGRCSHLLQLRPGRNATALRDGSQRRGRSADLYGDGRYGSPAWSPRGDLIAFTNIKGGAFHIGIMRADGSDERLLTRSHLDQSPTWAPNGRIIMFAREDAGGRSRLMTIDVTGYNEQMVPTPLDASDPDWSPLIP